MCPSERWTCSGRSTNQGKNSENFNDVPSSCADECNNKSNYNPSSSSTSLQMSYWPEDPPPSRPQRRGRSSSIPLSNTDGVGNNQEQNGLNAEEELQHHRQSSWYSRLWNNWTFAYMDVVLKKGASQNSKDGVPNLSQQDLFPVPESMKSTHLVETFTSEQQHLLEEAVKQQNNHEDTAWSQKRYQHQKNTDGTSIYRILWRIGAPTFVPAGFCELVVVFCNTGLPLLVRELLRIIEENPNSKIINEGLPYAIGIFVVSVVNGLANHRHRHLAMKTGVALRASVVNIIYVHILNLSPEGRQGLFSGEVTNLVAVETQKLFEVTQDGHLIWALPLSIVLVSIFLYLTLGPSTLVGIVTLAMFVPIIQHVTSTMLIIRRKRTKCSDERVEIISSMLQGMQVTKLNHYEPNYESRIHTARNQELLYLGKEMAIWGITLLIQVSSPVLATALTFATYVLIDENNILTAADTFAVLLLFSALRFPINFAGRLIGKAAQAMSAIHRIAVFLNRPLRDEQDQTKRIMYDDTDDDMEPTKTADMDSISIPISPTWPTAAPPTEEDHTSNKNKANSNDVDVNDGKDKSSENTDVPLTLSKATFRVGEVAGLPTTTISSSSGGLDDCGGFVVSEFNFSISKGEVIAVCGPVGSGKSTLVNGILDEAQALGNSRVTKGAGIVSYVPQTPFIINRTLRENILFGLPMDRSRYEAVLDACSLRTDLEQLGEIGDLTEIGERGVTLSGGQKQRVSIARAAYAQSSLIIFDDPFSALDSGTGKLVFERLIASPQAFLKDSAILLVTHATHFLTNPAVDKLLLIVDGRNQFFGSWDELTSFHPDDSKTIRAVEHIQSSVREEREADEEESKDEEDGAAAKRKKSKKVRGPKTGNDCLIQAEKREHGLPSIKTWMLWFHRAGGWLFFFMQLFLFSIDKVLFVSIEFFLAKWTEAADDPVEIFGVEFPPQTEGLSAQAVYLKVYSIIILIFVVAAFLRSEWAVLGGCRASRNVFYTMLSSILRAPMSYFETVPMGRILNRFTYDTDVNDVTLTQTMSMFMLSCSWYLTAVVLQIAILPWSALSIVPVSLMYWFLMLRYRMSGPDLQRIDALSRSPLQSMVGECLEGATSIRVFNQDEHFVARYRSVADANSSAILNFVSAQRWLGVRMEMLGSIVVLVSSVLVVCLNDVLGLEAGIVGLLIMWSSYFTLTLNFLVDTFSETEAAITSIERVDAMADLPTEESMETDDARKLPESWPEQGSLQFDGVNLRYREGLPLVLKDLSFDIPAGKSCGVVGRTGAGKSSISVALFRLVEIESGRICLDGVDLRRVGLADVRGRGMAIIPQDPFLAGATLRECLDPFVKHTDDEMLEALDAVRLSSTTGDAASVLGTKLEEGGSNYSVGERQLLNLARALLSQPKLLVLDEATASIDGETDAFIQKMLRTRFPNTTLVTIAHRLQSIIDYDLCLVMDAGQAAEFGPPVELLNSPEGIFSGLVDATGTESSKMLREIASEADRHRAGIIKKE